MPIARWFRKWSAPAALRAFRPPYKLHLGCGQNHFDGWINVDLARATVAELRWDLNDPLPLPACSAALIYHEHVLEHLPVDRGVRLLKECFRLLAPGGTLRIAMPSLRQIVDRYNGDWKDQDWLRWPEYQFIQTRAEMLNVALRWWGHEYVYDEEELRRRLAEAGFDTRRAAAEQWGQSRNPELGGRETRKDSALIIEVTKPA